MLLEWVYIDLKNHLKSRKHSKQVKLAKERPEKKARGDKY